MFDVFSKARWKLVNKQRNIITEFHVYSVSVGISVILFKDRCSDSNEPNRLVYIIYYHIILIPMLFNVFKHGNV